MNGIIEKAVSLIHTRRPFVLVLKSGQQHNCQMMLNFQVGSGNLTGSIVVLCGNKELNFDVDAVQSIMEQ